MNVLAPFLGLLGMFGALLLGGLYIGGAAWLAWWMLEPINLVAGHLRASTRYLLTDFLGLMVLLQAALAAVGRAIETRPGDDRSPYWIVLFTAMLLMFVLWSASVSVVSRAGIIRPWRRLAVMLLLVPGALAVIVGWPVAVVAIAVQVGLLENVYREGAFAGMALTIAGCLLLVAAPFGLRRLSFWSLVGSPGGETLADLQRARTVYGTPIEPPAPGTPTL